MPQKSSNKNEKKSIKGPPAPIKINEKTKEAYLVTIRDLEYKLSRYQAKQEALAESIDNYESQFKKLSFEENNMIRGLSNDLENQTQKHLDLVQLLNELHETKEINRADHESKIQKLKNEYKQTKNEILSNNNKMATELQILEEFRANRVEVIARAADLEQTLKTNAEENKIEFETIEKKNAEAIISLKMKAVEMSKEAGNNFRIQTESDMPATLKRTLHENVSIQKQLSSLQLVETDMKNENVELKKQAIQNKKTLKEMEANEIELTTKLVAIKKIVQMIERKIASLEK